MNRSAFDLNHLANDELMQQLGQLSRRSSELSAELLAHLAEVEKRQLYLPLGIASLFTYCLTVLHWTEDVAGKRIRAARAVRAFPLIYELVARGDLHLSAVCMLAPYLTEENHRDLCKTATHQSKRALAERLAALFPQADAVTLLRKLPARPPPSALPLLAASPTPTAHPQAASATTETATVGLSLAAETSISPSGEGPHRPPCDLLTTPPVGARTPNRLEPLAADRFRLQLTLSRATNDKLLRVQKLLRHRQPDGDLAVVLDVALTGLLEKLEARKFGKRRAGKGGEKKQIRETSAAKAPAPGRTGNDPTPLPAPGLRIQHIL